MTVATVVTLSTPTNGSTKTTSLMRPALFTRLVVGTMVSVAPLCLDAVTAHLVRLATSLTLTTSTMWSRTALSQVKKP